MFFDDATAFDNRTLLIKRSPFSEPIDALSDQIFNAIFQKP